MRHWVLTGLLCLRLGSGAQALAGDSLRTIVNDAFGPGESFEFTIGYGPVEAGTARMEVKRQEDVEGHRVLRIVSTATSNRVFDSFYKVRDTLSSWMDVRGMFPWRFEQRQREGDYERSQTVIFDPAHATVSTRGEQYDAPAYIQDILSAFYFVRAQALHVGDTLQFPHWSERKAYQLRVIVHERESIKTEAGQFDCLKVEPVLETEGMFRQQGKVFIWLTDDRLHMPVLVRSRLVVGAIEAELVAYRLGELPE
jgi:hypothetical protein